MAHKLEISIFFYFFRFFFKYFKTSRGVLYSGPVDALAKIWKSEGAAAFLKVSSEDINKAFRDKLRCEKISRNYSQTGLTVLEACYTKRTLKKI